ncbi:MAG: HPF/RaiA family ribosome-associated protein [Planctomycetaceae bacterium]
MHTPLEIEFRHLDRSEAVETNIENHLRKLEECFARITRCEVVVEQPHRHHHQGNLFHVRITLSVPGRKLVVNRSPAANHAHEDIYVTVRDAFHAMRRQLEDYARELRGDVKQHGNAPHGRVIRLNPTADHGVLETADGREIYFHRNAVLGSGFDHLRVGDRVHFAEEQGDQGPQASTVHLD